MDCSITRLICCCSRNSGTSTKCFCKVAVRSICHYCCKFPLNLMLAVVISLFIALAGWKCCLWYHDCHINDLCSELIHQSGLRLPTFLAYSIWHPLQTNSWPCQQAHSPNCRNWHINSNNLSCGSHSIPCSSKHGLLYHTCTYLGKTILQLSPCGVKQSYEYKGRIQIPYWYHL